jgi:hypothetical protein
MFFGHLLSTKEKYSQLGTILNIVASMFELLLFFLTW